MKDVIVIIAVTAVIVFGFFIMKRLDAFLEANEEATKKEYKNTPDVQFLDMDDYEKVISDIEKFKTTHEDIKLIIYDGKNDDLTDMIKLYNHTGIEVYETEGKGKNRTQRIMIYYRFVGYIEISGGDRKRSHTANTRKGVAVQYLTA